jgi:tetrapyrrole methylase family protein / MazG family protein
MRKFKKLTKLAKKLRSPNGCPWDKSRKLEDMPEYLREEIEEVIEAIEKNDSENLKEEIGDILFTLILTAQIAEEEGKLKMKDVLKGIEQKIISRHTWVFGKDKAHTPEEALAKWKENKLVEKAKK